MAKKPDKKSTSSVRLFLKKAKRKRPGVVSKKSRAKIKNQNTIKRHIKVKEDEKIIT
jgi:hypothetical protein